MYPNKLNKIIDLFEILPEDERRETLVSYADNAKKQEPREGEKFDLAKVDLEELVKAHHLVSEFADGAVMTIPELGEEE